MFLDEAIIEVRGGNGGRGCVSWRREKYVPRGGPDGGNGGDGGNIVLLADENTDTLSAFASKKKFEAEKGRFGSGQRRNGKNGEDLFLHVPPGTVISEFEEIGDVKQQVFVTELLEHGDQLVLAHGGRGGYGNSHFKGSTRQSPDFAELGEPGERKVLKLELKLVADAGIIGYPSVGKSTLISVISSARPKIGDYPFTTLVPNLGVVGIDDRTFVVCDVPGLIEGASEGKGLGDLFLRHIERCGVLVHLLDISRAILEGAQTAAEQADILIRDYKAIRKELEAYSPTLSKKRELIVLNKIDLLGDKNSELEAEMKQRGVDIFASISAATKSGIEDFKNKLFPIVLEERKQRQRVHDEEEVKLSKEIPVLRPHLSSFIMGAYKVEKRADGAIQVRGKRLEQFTSMTDFENEGALRRFLDVIERIGLKRAIKSALDGKDAPVYIGQMRVEEYL